MTTNEMLMILAAYTLAVVIVSFIAESRGHSFGTALLAGFFTSPLIAAILFAPYAPGYTVAKSSGSTNTKFSLVTDKPESSWTSAQVKLKESYERGEITVEEYQKQWNKKS